VPTRPWIPLRELTAPAPPAAYVDRGAPTDGAQLPAPLAPLDSEFCWYIFEGAGRAPRGPRRIAGLFALHRTGPRVQRLGLGPALLTGRDLPPPLAGLVPAWLPLWSPVQIELEDRPLLAVAIYDLDAPAPPLVLEREAEHADLELATLSAQARDGSLQLRRGLAAAGEPPVPPHLAAFCAGAPAASLIARAPALELDLCARARKPRVAFGPGGSPALAHGRITTSYVQQPRLDVVGSLRLRGEPITHFVGEGVHDHQWLRVRSPSLKWIWPHLRLPDGSEVTGYVIRDSLAGRHADADDGAELGRGGWRIAPDGAVQPLARFDVRALAHVDTERGRVPTRFAVAAPELGLQLQLDHVVPAPYLRMRAFGDAFDAGIYEGPIDVRGAPAIRGWVEVMSAATARLAGRAEPRR
jgi:hypothetical protein